MLDFVCKESTFKILETIMTKFENQSSQLTKELDRYDEHGFAIVHYLTHINYYESVSLVSQHGANLNLKTKYGREHPLFIAAAHGHEETVQVLI